MPDDCSADLPVTEEYPPPELASSPQIDTSVSHSARVWNYWLGGKDNYTVDRQAGDRIAAMLPEIVAHARADRAFLGRAVRFLAGEASEPPLFRSWRRRCRGRLRRR